MHPVMPHQGDKRQWSEQVILYPSSMPGTNSIAPTALLTPSGIIKKKAKEARKNVAFCGPEQPTT
jgi:hypothetical protein